MFDVQNKLELAIINTRHVSVIKTQTVDTMSHHWQTRFFSELINSVTDPDASQGNMPPLV